MLKTVNDINFKITESDKEFEYQKSLTEKLDSLNGDFDQNIINEIVLWKVNRYAELNDQVLSLLNLVDSTNSLDENLIRELLFVLLNTKGIQLPMASTILRFKNPKYFQIIDQRVYRILYGNELKLTTGNSERSILKNIELYIKYLEDLKTICNNLNISFEKSDRILYEADKRLNSNIKLNNYG